MASRVSTDKQDTAIVQDDWLILGKTLP